MLTSPCTALIRSPFYLFSYIYCTYITTTTSVLLKAPNLRASRELGQDEVVYGTYLAADVQYEDHSDGHFDAIEMPNGDILTIEADDNTSNEVKDKIKQKGLFQKTLGYESGESQIALTGTIDGSKFKIKSLPPKAQGNANGHGRRKLATVIGDKSILVVRIKNLGGGTTSTSVSASVPELSDDVFGTDGDGVNLKSQYAACSHGKLNIIPAPDEISNNAGATAIVNGVTEVTVNVACDGSSTYCDGAVRNAANTIIDSAFGSDVAHHRMFCLPPSSMNGIAYAYINWRDSVYSDNWCRWPSAQLHEIGHNINLAHSGEGGSTYADQSGMMGFSVSTSPDSDSIALHRILRRTTIELYAELRISTPTNSTALTLFTYIFLFSIPIASTLKTRGPSCASILSRTNSSVGSTINLRLSIPTPGTGRAIFSARSTTRTELLASR